MTGVVAITETVELRDNVGSYEATVHKIISKKIHILRLYTLIIHDSSQNHVNGIPLTK